MIRKILSIILATVLLSGCGNTNEIADQRTDIVSYLDGLDVEYESFGNVFRYFEQDLPNPDGSGESEGGDGTESGGTDGTGTDGSDGSSTEGTGTDGNGADATQDADAQGDAVTPTPMPDDQPTDDAEREYITKGSSFDIYFTAYIFTGYPSSLYYTNVEEIAAESLEGLNTEFWSFEPLNIVLGQTELLKGLEVALEGCQYGDIVNIIMSSDMAYGAKGSGVVPPNTSVMYQIQILDQQ